MKKKNKKKNEEDEQIIQLYICIHLNVTNCFLAVVVVVAVCFSLLAAVDVFEIISN